MPTAAFQYCEAMRVASSFGWYVYCPIEISLYFDGKEVFHHEDGRWNTLKSINLPADFRNYWNSIAPSELVDMDPPFLTQISVPGFVQVWSGYLIKSAEGWATNIRPPVNVDTRSSISLYEGIVETSVLQFMPLFINFRILKTDIEVYIPTNRPLFQIQPVHQSCYHRGQRDIEVLGSRHLQKESEVWSRYSETIRRTDDTEARRPGRYAVAVRKRSNK